MTYINLDEFKKIEIGKEVKHIIIAISGLSGSGKGTHAKLLQKRLKKDFNIDVPVYESGEIFRAEAKKREMSIKEFGELLENNEKLSQEMDKTVDKTTLKKALTGPGIFVGRLATYVIGNHGYKIFLEADYDIVAERISKDPEREETKRGLTKEEIKREIIKRDQDNAKRYNKLYGIDYEKDLRERANIVVKNEGLVEEVFEEFYKPLVAWLKEKGFVK